MLGQLQGRRRQLCGGLQPARPRQDARGDRPGRGRIGRRQPARRALQQRAEQRPDPAQQQRAERGAGEHLRADQRSHRQPGKLRLQQRHRRRPAAGGSGSSVQCGPQGSGCPVQLRAGHRRELPVRRWRAPDGRRPSPALAGGAVRAGRAGADLAAGRGSAGVHRCAVPRHPQRDAGRQPRQRHPHVRRDRLRPAALRSAPTARPRPAATTST